MKGLTLLHWATDRGHSKIIKALIERGAEVDLEVFFLLLNNNRNSIIKF